MNGFNPYQAHFPKLIAMDFSQLKDYITQRFVSPWNSVPQLLQSRMLDDESPEEFLVWGMEEARKKLEQPNANKEPLEKYLINCSNSAVQLINETLDIGKKQARAGIYSLLMLQHFVKDSPKEKSNLYNILKKYHIPDKDSRLNQFMISDSEDIYFSTDYPDFFLFLAETLEWIQPYTDQPHNLELKTFWENLMNNEKNINYSIQGCKGKLFSSSFKHNVDTFQNLVSICNKIPEDWVKAVSLASCIFPLFMNKDSTLAYFTDSFETIFPDAKSEEYQLMKEAIQKLSENEQLKLKRKFIEVGELEIFDQLVN